MAVTALIIISSCKKDDPAPKPLEKSIVATAYLVNYNTSITASGSGGYEYGIKFAVTQNGKVTSLGARMPTAGSYRVTLWDASVTPQAVLSTSNVTVGSGAASFNSITPVALTTGKDYFISIWSNSNWFQLSPLGGGSFTYPITQGSVEIRSYQWVSSATATPQKFPVNVDNSYVAGIMDFHFQPD